MPNGASTAHLYRPKLITVLGERYGWASLRQDAIAGLTVAIVALPLSMAIAVASGVGPERGLFTAIVGGAVVSALGGSRFQIGGPAGAFIVLVAEAVARFGLEGLFAAVFVSGLLLVLAGFLKLGALIRRIPHAVTVGFTAGIGAIIAASQIKDFLGLKLAEAEPGPFFAKIRALSLAMPSFNAYAFVLGVGVAALILGLRAWRPALPGLLMAVVLASVVAAGLHWPVETIQTHFGVIPNHLPAPHWPLRSLAEFWLILPTALRFTMLGGIESLLSATVADAMTKRRHRYNMELVAQGLANVATSFFGGICVTGTIARTAANVRAGARSPLSGMMHALFLLLFMLIAAPLAGYIPLAALAGVLMTVCWGMIEKPEMARLMRDKRHASVLLATLGVTLAYDLIYGIAAGCVLAGLWALLGRYDE